MTKSTSESQLDMAKRWARDAFAECEQRRADRRKNNNEKAARWRAKQDPDKLKAQQRMLGGGEGLPFAAESTGSCKISGVL